MIIENKVAEKQAQVALARFNAAKNALNDFISDNEEIMDAFFKLASNYNMATSMMRDSMRGLPADKAYKMGEFKRNKSKTSYKYDPMLLSAKILRIPGVIKTIDGKRLEELHEEGTISEEELEAAKSEYETTPQLRGPKEVELKFAL